MTPPNLPSQQRPDLESLVRNIRSGDAASVEQLRQLLTPGIRFLISRLLGANADALAGETFLVSIQAIQNHEICDGKQLLTHVRSLIRSRIAGSQSVPARQMPGNEPVSEQKLDLLRRSLQGMSGRDREILQRLYVLGQEESRIRAEMQLSPAQLRVVKSKAKAHFRGPGVGIAHEPGFGSLAVKPA